MSPEMKNYDERMLKTIEVVKSNFAAVRAGGPTPVCWTESQWSTMAPPPP